MYITYDHLTREELIERLDKMNRLFDVAYSALFCMTCPGSDRDFAQDAANAIALIRRYPNDKRYRCDADEPSSETALESTSERA